MRVRSKVELAQSVATAQWQRKWRNFGGAAAITYPVETATTVTASASRRTEDQVTYDFKKRIARGDIIVNDYNSVLFEDFPVLPVDFSLTATVHNHLGYPDDYEAGWWYTGSYIPFYGYGGSPPFLPVETNVAVLRQQLTNLAVTKAYANVDASDMLSLATLAESGKTVEFLSSTFRRAIRVFKAVRKLELRKLKREISMREFKDRYMECRYAIRPMIYDVNNTVKALKAPRGRLRKTYRGVAEDSITTQDQLIGKTFMGGVAVDIERKRVTTIKARAGVLCDVNVSMLSPFGGDKILETAWELLPFSFVADWFGNIGQTIGAWAPKVGVNQLASWVVVTETSTATNEVVNPRMTAARDSRTWTLSCSIPQFAYGQRTTSVTRTASPELRMWPQFNMNLSTYKLLDLGIICKNILR